MPHPFALALIATGAALGLWAIFVVGTSNGLDLAWDTVLIGLSAGVVAAGIVVWTKLAFVGFIVAPVVGVIEAVVLFGLPWAH